MAVDNMKKKAKRNPGGGRKLSKQDYNLSAILPVSYTHLKGKMRLKLLKRLSDGKKQSWKTVCSRR